MRIFKERMVSGAGFSLAGIYLASYVLLQYSGLFGPVPENIMRVLHRGPSLAGIAALVLYGLAWGYAHRTVRDATGRFHHDTLLRFAYAGMMVCAAGILVSGLTRFEGRLALSEGQETSLAAENFDAGTLYRRKFSRAPRGSLLVHEVERFPPDGAKGPGLPAARVRYRSEGAGEPREFRIGSVFPNIHDGSAFAITSAGYSPHVFLFDRGGDLIENFYAVLQLSPPGAEDMFRFDGIIPHTFYVRYYPEVSLFPDVAGAAPAPSGPVYRVRIVRNLDIVADEYATPDDTVFFDKLIFSAGDVRKWVEVEVVRDPGMYLVWPGFALLLCCAIAIAVRRYVMKARA